jgi:hypothetical protein
MHLDRYTIRSGCFRKRSVPARLSDWLISIQHNVTYILIPVILWTLGFLVDTEASRLYRAICTRVPSQQVRTAVRTGGLYEGKHHGIDT